MRALYVLIVSAAMWGAMYGKHRNTFYMDLESDCDTFEFNDEVEVGDDYLVNSDSWEGTAPWKHRPQECAISFDFKDRLLIIELGSWICRPDVESPYLAAYENCHRIRKNLLLQFNCSTASSTAIISTTTCITLYHSRGTVTDGYYFIVRVVAGGERYVFPVALLAGLAMLVIVISLLVARILTFCLNWFETRKRHRDDAGDKDMIEMTDMAKALPMPSAGILRKPHKQIGSCDTHQGSNSLVGPEGEPASHTHKNVTWTDTKEEGQEPDGQANGDHKGIESDSDVNVVYPREDLLTNVGLQLTGRRWSLRWGRSRNSNVPSIRKGKFGMNIVEYAPLPKEESPQMNKDHSSGTNPASGSADIRENGATHREMHSEGESSQAALQSYEDETLLGQPDDVERGSVSDMSGSLHAVNYDSDDPSLEDEMYANTGFRLSGEASSMDASGHGHSPQYMSEPMDLHGRDDEDDYPQYRSGSNILGSEHDGASTENFLNSSLYNEAVSRLSRLEKLADRMDSLRAEEYPRDTDSARTSPSLDAILSASGPPASSGSSRAGGTSPTSTATDDQLSAGLTSQYNNITTTSGDNQARGRAVYSGPSIKILAHI